MANIIETFFTTVGCMDGRVQEVVAKHGKKTFVASYPDTITEAGLVGKLMNRVSELEDSLHFKIVTVSLQKHASKGIIVHGHAECAGNPVDDSMHKEQIKNAVMYIRDMINNKVTVIGVFVKRSEDKSKWEIEEI